MTNIKKWFGKSKILNLNGEPLVVYHGTITPGFDIFKKQGYHNLFGMDDGFYFTDSPEEASGYAIENYDNLSKGRKGVGAVYPSFLKIIKPADLRPDTWNVDDINVQEFLENMDLDGLLVELKAKGYDGIIYDGTLVPIPVTGNHYLVFESEQIHTAIVNFK